ncbi:hypothetical protein FRB94_003073 [Tulasnella sp. JGI-2019a]|nr:hypothetical protein FRB94_003073 [Tulasnella sp. JGI-2019a]
MTDLNTLPYQYDPLIYAKTLTTPGLCFWCLGDMKQPATLHMQQYLTRDQWQRHIKQEHLAKSTCCKVPICLHPHCLDTFKTLENRNYHLQDAHCWIPRSVMKPKASRKHSHSEKEEDELEDEEEDVVKETNEKPRKCTKQGTAAAGGR